MRHAILHHYELSPFGTAMRLALAHKGIPWKSVAAPLVAPKPDLSALTGGYERIPVLQLGADIYCDTACITAALEALQPEPTLYPGETGFSARMIALWSGSAWFIPAIGAALGDEPNKSPDDFWEDRARRFGLVKSNFLPALPHLRAQFAAGAQLVADALQDGRAFVGGDSVGHADFALYVNIRFAGLGGVRPGDFGEQLAAWCDRVSAIGFGDFEQWSAEQAIDHAAQTEPQDVCLVETASGFSAGQQVSIKVEAPDPAAVMGELVGLNDRRISIARVDQRAGKVHVHFPRLGQILQPV